MNFFIQGLSLGLAYVVPIGLQNLFVINSALTEKRRRALLNALIVIIFDITLALVCFFGMGALMQRLPRLQTIILGAGGLLVCAVGVALLFSGAAQLKPRGQSSSIGKTVLSACVVTWCNPQALIDSAVLLGAFRGVLPAAGHTPFIYGVAAASCLWFTALTLIVSRFGEHLSPGVMRGVNMVCGGVIILYGARLLYAFAARVL